MNCDNELTIIRTHSQVGQNNHMLEKSDTTAGSQNAVRGQ